MDRDATDPVAGDLRHAFDTIVAELDKVRRDSETYNRQLLQRNRELAATAAVAQAISTEQVDLVGMLERTLQVILEVTGLRRDGSCCSRKAAANRSWPARSAFPRGCRETSRFSIARM